MDGVFPKELPELGKGKLFIVIIHRYHAMFPAARSSEWLQYLIDAAPQP